MHILFSLKSKRNLTVLSNKCFLGLSGAVERGNPIAVPFGER